MRAAITQSGETPLAVFRSTAIRKAGAPRLPGPLIAKAPPRPNAFSAKLPPTQTNTAHNSRMIFRLCGQLSP
jgi:hypothetical protein